jgi:hypothetical protein
MQNLSALISRHNLAFLPGSLAGNLGAIAAEIQTLRIACQPQERRDKRKQVLYSASRLCALSIR